MIPVRSGAIKALIEKYQQPFVYFVTLGMSLAVFAFVWRYGRNVPFHDEYRVFDIFMWDGDLAAWLWRTENEHRFPFPKLFYYFIAQSSHLNLRLIMLANVACVVAVVWAMILGVRRWRGALKWTDILIPVALLHYGHYWNFLMSIQTFVIWATLLQCWFVYLIFTRGYERRSGAIAMGAILCLLPLHGGNGLSVLPPLWCYSVWIAWRLWGRGQAHDRERASWIGVGAALAALGAVAYMIGFGQVSEGAPHDSMLRFVAITLQYLSMALGDMPLWLWPVGAGIMVALLAASLALVTGSLIHSKADETRWQLWGYAAVLAAFMLQAIVLGWGRSAMPAQTNLLGIDPWEVGIHARFVTMLPPLLFSVYFLWEDFSPRRWHWMPALLALLIVLPLPFHTRDGIRYGGWRRNEMDVLLQQARSGLDTARIAERHAEMIFPWDVYYFKLRLDALKTKQLPPFREE